MSSIVLFDGVCNFCNGAVSFIIKRDHARRFKFAPLQSEIGEELTAKFGIGEGVDSIVLVEDEQAFTHSTATLRVARGLGGAWSLAYALIVVPAAIRDWFYKVFARHRYALFGRKDVCMVPTREIRERFLA